MKRLWTLVLASKLSVVIRLACLCAGLSLFFMVLLGIVKIPLFLVLGVGVAHAFGILGVLLFGVAVIKETLSQRSRLSIPPPKADT
jgi:hypothetical protein